MGGLGNSRERGRLVIYRAEEMMKAAVMMLGVVGLVEAQSKDGGVTVPAGCTSYNDGCNTCR